MSARAALRFGLDADAPAGPLLAEATRGATPAEAIALPLAKAPERERAALRAGARAAAALPARAALLVRLRPPAALSPAKRRAVLAALLAAELPFPVADCVARFEETEGGAAVLAHVARRADVAARLAALRDLGCDPAALVPPGPALWRAACAARPLPAGTPRAVLFPSGGETVLAAGRGADLASVHVFSSGDASAADLRLRLAFGGLPADLVRQDLPPDALARALAAFPDAAPDLRAADFPHPAAERRAAAAERAAAARDRDAALAALAGYPVRTKGGAALEEARAAAAARRDEALFTPDRAADLPPVVEAAAARGARLSHLELAPAGLSASGSAPDAAAAEAFAADLRARGFRTALGEPPAPVEGGVSFYLVPAAP